jgi:beta-phosphoglucomutase-like phosphatase (HAD superfamily)
MNLQLPKLSKYKGVLFDLDGTLIDSLDLWEKADADFWRQFGANLPDNQNTIRQAFLVEHKLSEWTEFMLDTYKIPNITPKQAEHAIDGNGRQLIKFAKYKNLANVFLQGLKNDLKRIGLVSSSTNDVIETLKYNNEFTPDFKTFFNNSNVVCRADVNGQTKPHPYPYFLGVEKLGLEPYECIAFEDALSGTISAAKAGLDVCVVYDKHQDADRSKLKQLTNFHITGYNELISSSVGKF